jgi:4-amino-4-deoxy-L-arabinose transferase-like glycosyltransferase
MSDVSFPEPTPPTRDALAKARAAVMAEAKGQRRAGWKGGALWASGTVVFLAAAVAGTLLAVGACTLETVSSRAATLIALTATGVVTMWAALRPQGHVSRILSVGVVALSAVFIVFVRGPGAPSLQPEWLCTVSHLALGLVPAAVVITVLRGMAPHRLRSTLAGLAAGTTGAIAGELGCGQSSAHVAVFHLSAWGAVALLVALVSSTLAPKSYAP